MATLSRIERKILANQYAILELIDRQRADEYKGLKEIVEHGFEAEYEDVLREVFDESDTMSEEECGYVGDVLQMYDMMQTAYKSGRWKEWMPQG